MIHAHLIKLRLDQHSKCRNHLINLYSKCCVFGYARKLLDESPEPDLVSWSALISGYVLNDLGYEALSGFMEMHALGIRCNEFTFPSVLKACSMKKDIVGGKQIHGVVVVTGFESDVFVANTLVVVYAKCGDFMDSRRLFDQIPERNIVSWNALFSCYTQGDFFEKAIELFQDMIGSGLRPDEFSLSTIINACTGLRDINQGRKIHGYLMKHGYSSDPFSCFQGLGQQFHSVMIKSEIELDPFLCCGLIDIYSKCGEMEDAARVYSMMPKKELIALNALLCGHSQNNNDIEALSLFAEEHRDGVGFNETTLLAILNSAASLQVVNISEQIHGLSLRTGFQSDSFVINSLIDSYAKCGHVEKARKVFDESPIADLATFTSLISAYAQSGQASFSKRTRI
ncbi:hypothetical protein R6Q59_005079 [Mikania micrantha]